MNRKFLAISAISIVAISVIGLTFFAKPKTSKAFGPTIVLIDLKLFATELAQAAVEKILDVQIKKYVNSFVGSALGQRIRNYADYTQNLKTNNVDQSLQSAGGTDKFILKTLIGQLDDQANNLPNRDLGPLYQQSAVKSYDITSAPNVSPANANFFLASAGNFSSTPFGQETIKLAQALDINAKADANAKTEISLSQGFKSTYGCGVFATPIASASGSNQVGAAGTTLSGLSNGKAASAAASGGAAAGATQASNITNCLINNPGEFIANGINSDIASIFQSQNNPPANHVSQIVNRLANGFAAGISSKILNGR